MTMELRQKNIKCINCKFAQPDLDASEKNWTAWQCTCPDSPYEGALLNITYHSGSNQASITWQGCEHGTETSEQQAG